MQNKETLKVGCKHTAVLSACLVMVIILSSGTLSVAADAFSSADLAGSWKAHMINSSAAGWEGWNRLDFTIDNSGGFTANWSDSDMDTGTDTGTLSIDATGIVTITGAASLEGVMRSDKQLFVLTGEYSGSGNDPYLMVGVKQTGTIFSTSDLAGNWKAHVIHSCDSCWEGWDRTDFSIDASGNFTADWTGSDQDSGSTAGALSLDANGVVTLIGDASFEGIMSPDKNLVVMTGQYASSGGDPLLMMIVKQDCAAFRAADLSGEWKAHSIYSSASGWEGWERADLNFDDVGNFTVNWSDSDQDSGTGSGTLIMSAIGIITQGGDASLAGIMDCGKGLVVITNDYDDSQLTVCVARSSADPDGYPLYFPHVSTLSLWQTEIALINNCGQAVTGTLKGFSNSGELVETQNVSLAAHGRKQITVANEFTDHANIGYMVFYSDTEGAVGGYTKFFQSGLYRTAIPAVDEVNTSDIYISHIASNNSFWTGLSLVNTTAVKKNMTITFNDGRSVNYAINANEHKTFTVAGLFGGQPQTAIKSGVISNASGVIGLELFGNSTQLDGLLLTDDTASTIYYPHVADMNTWWTGIVAYNPSVMASDLTVSPYSENGTALPPVTLSIPGGEKYIGVVKDLALDARTAWFKIDSTRPLSGFELFGTINGKLLAAYAEGSGTGAKEGVFAKIEKSGWTGIAFVNTDNSLASVTLTAYSDSGAVIATSTINVGGHEKVVNMAEAIFTPQNISNATYISFTSDKNVVGFQLNGSSDGKMLDGFPSL